MNLWELNKIWEKESAAICSCRKFISISYPNVFYITLKKTSKTHQDRCSYLLVSQSFFQTSRDDLLRPEDLSSQQFIPSGHHLQPLPLPVTSLEGLCQAPWGNGLIYCFLKDRDDAYPGCTLWDEKANKAERFSVMFVLEQAELECSSCQSQKEHRCAASAATTQEFLRNPRKFIHHFALWAENTSELI